jgi:histidine triad (HIT) family protein
MSPSEECIFCSIARGDEPASVVARDGRFCAFLDFRPVFKGHMLVVPAAHTPDLAALPAEDVGPLFSLARRVALAVEKGLGAGGAFLGVNNKVSQSVAHLHVHVVPRTQGRRAARFLLAADEVRVGCRARGVRAPHRRRARVEGRKSVTLPAANPTPVSDRADDGLSRFAVRKQNALQSQDL